MSGGGLYEYRETAVITVTATAGWQFDEWTGPVEDPSAPSTTVLMDADKTVTAHFIQTWFEDDDPAIAYAPEGAWRQLNHPAASAGHGTWSSQAGARAEFTFTGTGLRWHLATGPIGGHAAVYLDGVRVATLDLYSPDLQLIAREKTGLPLDTHTVIIGVNGTKNPSSTGYVVDIDALEVIQ